MKYRPLTKEQLENLHKEFALFLASQEIDAKEWDRIKIEKPALVEKELNLFSDVVWEDVLTKVTYLSHFSKNTINLFKCKKEQIDRVVVQITNDINLEDKKGYDWLLANPKDDAVAYLKGSKKYTKERNVELFNLIEMGSTITDNKLYEYFYQLIP